jgi:hypothetical protein
MRFKEFLSEENIEDFDMDKFVNDCAPYLAQIEGVKRHELLKHGSRSGPDDWGIKKHERRSGPRDSDVRLHTAINDFFEEKFDWIARTDALFTTSHWQDAHGYGVVYLVFPIGKFQYLWSPDIDDLWAETCKIRSKVDNRYITYDDAKEKALCLTIDKVKESRWFFNKGLKQAMAARNEIMLKSLTERYYFIETNTDFTYAFLKELQQRGWIDKEE